MFVTCSRKARLVGVLCFIGLPPWAALAMAGQGGVTDPAGIIGQVTDGTVSTRRCEAFWRNQPIVKTW